MQEASQEHLDAVENLHFNGIRGVINKISAANTYDVQTANGTVFKGVAVRNLSPVSDASGQMETLLPSSTEYAPFANTGESALDHLKLQARQIRNALEEHHKPKSWNTNFWAQEFWQIFFLMCRRNWLSPLM